MNLALALLQAGVLTAAVDAASGAPVVSTKSAIPPDGSGPPGTCQAVGCGNWDMEIHCGCDPSCLAYNDCCDGYHEACGYGGGAAIPIPPPLEMPTISGSNDEPLITAQPTARVTSQPTPDANAPSLETTGMGGSLPAPEFPSTEEDAEEWAYKLYGVETSEPRTIQPQTSEPHVGQLQTPPPGILVETAELGN